MSCCPQYGCEDFFGERFARRSAERYRTKGLGKTPRSLFDFLVSRGLAGRGVLEIGGGVGALVTELVKAGAERGALVEVVPGYEPFAREIFDEAGVEVDFRLADLVVDPAGAEPADLVVLNQVVCCTPDGPALVGSAAVLTRVALAFTYPRERAVLPRPRSTPESRVPPAPAELPDLHPLSRGARGRRRGRRAAPRPRGRRLRLGDRRLRTWLRTCPNWASSPSASSCYRASRSRCTSSRTATRS